MKKLSPSNVFKTLGSALMSKWRHADPRIKGLINAIVSYFFVALVIWHPLWTHDMRSTTVHFHHWQDAPTYIWFLEWPVQAILNGHNPMYSPAMFPPVGINLVSHAGVLLIGLILSPITYFFGPIMSLNIALILSPVLSALTMFILIRRWVKWQPAAFVGGFMFGFSSFALVASQNGQLNLSMFVFLPLMVSLLDSILIRQERNPYLLGFWLALAVIGQFLIGTEILLMFAMISALCLCVLSAYALRTRWFTQGRIRYSVRAFSVTSVLATMILAYPTYFALLGPAHFKGRVWSMDIASFHIIFKEILFSNSPAGLNQTFCGFGVGLVALMGILAFRKSRGLWFFSGVAAVSLVLALGTSIRLAPWRLLAYRPLFENIIPLRFILFAIFSLSVVVAIVISRVFEGTPINRIGKWLQGNSQTLSRSRRVLPAFLVSLLVVLPFAIPVSRQMPMPTNYVKPPLWFTKTAPTLPKGQTLLTVPFPSFFQDAVLWQAIGHMHWTLASGPGPGSEATRNPQERRAMAVLVQMSFRNKIPFASDALEIRKAMVKWGVDHVVVDARMSPIRPSIIALFTSATGTLPRFSQGVWLWPGIHDMKGKIRLTEAEFETCIQVPSHQVMDVANCVVGFQR